MKLHFTEEESEAANDAWGANCGPHAVAAALGLKLDQVRPYFAPKFEEKFRERGYGFTNPTMMGNALAFARMPFRLEKNLHIEELREGICRIQWEGPWLRAGVPPIVAYGHTHWVAATATEVFCTAVPWYNHGGWIGHDLWRRYIALLCAEEKFTGWHVTHHYGFQIRAKEAA